MIEDYRDSRLKPVVRESMSRGFGKELEMPLEDVDASSRSATRMYAHTEKLVIHKKVKTLRGNT